MATPTSPTDMEVTEGEQASCSSSSAGGVTSSRASTSLLTTPASMVSMVSLGSEDDEERPDEAMLVSSCSTVISGALTMENEFEALDMICGWPQAYLEVSDQCHDYPYRVARAPENRSRNRYRDVSPYDHSRVRLRAATPAPGGGFHPGLGLALAMAGSSYSFSASSKLGDKGRGGDGDVHNDYINASFVVVEEAHRSYILTQGPLPNTCGHFWLMVWQQDSKAVIMLNRLVEKDAIKCSQYWPPCQGQTLLFEEMGISVHMLGEEVRPYHKIHYLRLENMLTGEAKAISHFHYTSWPDFGVPESPASFLDFLFIIRESGALNYEPGPVVIHCSAGIGRSGTFALIDTCLVLMEKRDNPFALNIRQVLVNMRKYRMGLIQTPEQLRFSYMAVIEGAKFLMGDEKVRKKWKDLTKEDHARSYSFDSSPPPSGVMSKKYKGFRLVLEDDDDDEIDDEADYSDLATRMPDSGEESSEGGAARKRARDDSKPGTSEDGNEKKEVSAKSQFKRKRLNLQDM